LQRDIQIERRMAMLSQILVFVFSLFIALIMVLAVEAVMEAKNILRDVIVFLVWLVGLSALGIMLFYR